MKFLRVMGADAIMACGQITEEYWNEMAEMEGHALTDIERVRLRSHMCLRFVDPSCAVNISTSDEGIHGFCITGLGNNFCRDRGLVATIHDMYVSKDFRGTVEVASGLYKLAEDWAKELGCSYLECNVSLFNDRVVTLLSKRGFDPIKIEYRKELEISDGRRQRRQRSERGSSSGSTVLRRGNGGSSSDMGRMARERGLRRDSKHNVPDRGEADEIRRSVHSNDDGGGSGGRGKATGGDA